MVVERNESPKLAPIEFTPVESSTIEFWTNVVRVAGTRGFIKGGFLRDKIASVERDLDLTPKDLDILVIDRINKIASIASNNGANIIERRRRKGTPVFRFSHAEFPDLDIEMGVALGSEYDIATFTSIRRDDALTSDLNVNAMSLVLGELMHAIYDPLDGVNSIRRGKISITSRDVLYKNPENVFRAVRVADKIDCRLNDWSYDLIFANAQVVSKIQREFLLRQIKPILDSPNAYDNWRLLKDLGVIEHAFPEKPNISVEEVRQLYG